MSDTELSTSSSAPSYTPRTVWLLLASVFIIATCGLIYELIAGTLASYLLGDSVTQFSTVIGVYLFAMGIGSWLSKFVTRRLALVFVQVEIMIGLVGGCTAALLFALFESVMTFRVMLYALVVMTGILVGLEIPLLLRLLKDRIEFKDLVARVLSLDYIGALLASLLFPLWLVPHVGLMRSSFLFGFLNALVGVGALFLLRSDIAWWRGVLAQGIVVLMILFGGVIYSDTLLAWSERGWYGGENVIFAKSSPYQRMVMTRNRDEFRLYLNGNLQFSSRDEYRYHESLVHPALVRVPKAEMNVLVLGGGDGLAVREVLRHPEVKHITLVDLDPAMTGLFTTHPLLVDLNQHSLSSPKVEVVNSDAFTWLENARQKFDAVIIDFPDPSSFSLGKLYTVTFYQRLRQVLEADAVVAIQTTSPLFARRSFWCVENTLRTVGFQTLPYHAYVPSFGEWGFIIASMQDLHVVRPLPEGMRFLTVEGFASMQHFTPDMSRVESEVNKLNNQVLVRLFESEWGRYTN